jgi:hypothetical protein
VYEIDVANQSYVGVDVGVDVGVGGGAGIVMASVLLENYVSYFLSPVWRLFCAVCDCVYQVCTMCAMMALALEWTT